MYTGVDGAVLRDPHCFKPWWECRCKMAVTRVRKAVFERTACLIGQVRHASRRSAGTIVRMQRGETPWQ